MTSSNGTKKAWWKPLVVAIVTAICAGGGGFGIWAQSDSSETKDVVATVATAVASVQREMTQRDVRIGKVQDTASQNSRDIAGMKANIENTDKVVGVIQGDVKAIQNSLINIETLIKLALKDSAG